MKQAIKHALLAKVKELDNMKCDLLFDEKFSELDEELAEHQVQFFLLAVAQLEQARLHLNLATM